MDEAYDLGNSLAQGLRATGLNVLCDYSDKTIGDRIKKALAEGASYLAVVGKNEEKTKLIKIKNLSTREEKEFKLDLASTDEFKKIAEEIKGESGPSSL